MWPRLLFVLGILALPLACTAGDDHGATGPTTTQDTGQSGACGGEACDPLFQYCLIPVGAVGGEQDAGMCVALPTECPAADPCPCLLPLCADGVCAESDAGWALLTCNQG